MSKVRNIFFQINLQTGNLHNLLLTGSMSFKITEDIRWILQNLGVDENIHQLSMKPGPRFNIKMLSYEYSKSHCGDKTVVRSSYLHNGISYTGKMTSLYWIRAKDCITGDPVWLEIKSFKVKYNLVALGLIATYFGKYPNKCKQIQWNAIQIMIQSAYHTICQAMDFKVSSTITQR